MDIQKLTKVVKIYQIKTHNKFQLNIIIRYLQWISLK